MFKVSLLFFLTVFVLFRPFQLQTSGMLYGGDDSSYFAYSTSMVYFQYPHMEKEFVDEFNIPPLSRIGPGLMAAPFVGLFSIVDRITGHPIVEKRTRTNIVDSWSLFGSFFASVVYLWLSCFLLYRALLFYVKSEIASLSVILMVLCQGAMLYAVRRPIFSHVYELFIQSAFLYLFVRRLAMKSEQLNRNWILALTGLCALALLVRQNGIVYATTWPALILGLDLSRGEGRFTLARWKSFVAVWGVGFAAYLALKYLPWLLAPQKYVTVNAVFEDASFMGKFQGWSFYPKRVLWILFGRDWGLIYSAPFLLIGLAGLAIKSGFRYRRYFILAALPLLMNIYILVIWKTQGGWYGYRYLLFTAVPVLIVPFAVFLNTLQKRSRRLFWGCVSLAIFPTLSMLVFEHSTKTGLDPVVNAFGQRGWGNLNYQVEVWKLFLLHPIEFLYSFLKSGPAYIVYVIAQFLHVSTALPAKFRVYNTFFFHIMIKTFLIYSVPWALYFATRLGSRFLPSLASRR